MEIESTPFFSPGLGMHAHQTVQASGLTVGPPGDKYEMEADAMADNAVNFLHGNTNSPGAPFFQGYHGNAAIRTKCEECEQEPLRKAEESPATAGTLQTRAALPETGTPAGGRRLTGDTAGPIVATQAPLIMLQEGDTEEIQAKEEESPEDTSLQTKGFLSPAYPPEDALQRKCSECENEARAGGGGPSQMPSLEKTLEATSGEGRSMPEGISRGMENAFGSDFGGVRIHTGSDAVQMSTALKAQAFTHGSDIYFNQGKYNPESASGQHLLAHELTHTLQQGASAPSNKIQKVEAIPPAAADTFGQEATGLVSNADTTITYSLLPVTKFKTTGGREFLYEQFHLKRKWNYSGSRVEKGVKQRTIWRDNVDTKNVESILTEKFNKAHATESKSGGHKIYAFKVGGKKSRGTCYLTGTMANIVKEATIPKWNNLGQCPKYFQVDHIVEMQVSGFPESDRVNTIDNMELLEASANLNSGEIIRASIEIKVRQTLHDKEALAGLEAKLPQLAGTTDMDEKVKLVKNKYDLLFRDFTGKGGPMVKPNKYWIRSQIEIGDHMHHLEPVSLSELGSESNLLVFPRKYHPVGKIFRWDGKNQVPGSQERNWFKPWVITSKSFNTADPESETLGYLTLGFPEKFAHVRATGGTVEIKKLPGAQFAGYVDNVEGEAGGRKSVIDAGNFAVTHLSPVRFNDISFQDEGLRIEGKVLPTLDFIKKAELDLLIENGDIEISKTFTGDLLTLPAPFELRQTTLSLFISSKKGFGLDGSLDFGINRVGEGHLSAEVSQKGGFQLKGYFLFDTSLFDPAEISIGYKDNHWSMGGRLGIPKGRVKGLKKAEAEVHYEEGHLFAKGRAEPDLKGFEAIEMFLDIGKEGYTFGGKVNLAGVVPMVKKGELELTVSNTAENGLQLSGGGTVEPDIPGLKTGTAITISYNDGAILIHGKLPFTLGETGSEGEVSVGITNQTVNENNEPTGEIADTWTVFGMGSATIRLAKGIAASAEVKLEPSGDIIVSGTVGIDHSKDQPSENEVPLLDKELFKIGPTSVILFAIPPIGASLKLGIEGGAKVYAYITPPHFKELAVSLENFNLTHPDDNFEIKGKVAIGMSGRGGLSAYLTLKATLSVLIAAVEGSLTGSIGLEAKGDATASLGATWSKARGLELEEGKLEIFADAHFIAKLTGKLRVFLDLWLAEIDIWEEDLDIASIEFGPSIKTGFELPVSLKDGELKTGAFDKNSLKYPDISSPEKQQELVKEGASQDEKVKPPPPPSMEEALKAMRTLGAGPMDAWDVITMDADEARAKVAKASISRDTYRMWLKIKHGKTNWDDVFALADQRDQLDFNSFRATYISADLSPMQELFGLSEFSDDHAIYSKEHGGQVKALLRERREHKEPV